MSVLGFKARVDPLDLPFVQVFLKKNWGHSPRVYQQFSVKSGASKTMDVNVKIHCNLQEN